MQKLIIATVALTCLLASARAGESGLAGRMVEASGLRAGLCVHLGATDGKLTAELSAGGRFVVHGLTPDEAAVEKARALVASKGLYGKVVVEKGDLDHLFYADDMVNLVVVDDLPAATAKGLKLEEVYRILAPNGVAYVGAAGGLSAAELKSALEKAGIKSFKPAAGPGAWALITKSRPEGWDEWTHYNYDPGGNRVSQDDGGPPQYVQWMSGIEWQTASYRTAGMAAAGGRMFYSYNEYPLHKAKGSWTFLTARDAYSGVPLWRRPVQGFVPLTMIATDDRLYGSFDGKVGLVALDAATGERVKEYKVTPQWAVLHDGKLIVSEGTLKCLDAESGKTLWESKRMVNRVRSVPSVAIDGDKLFFVDSSYRAGKCAIGCIDLKSGNELWSKDLVEQFPMLKAGGGLSAYWGGTIIVGEAGKGAASEAIHAFSAEDGKHLWTHRYHILGVTGSRRKAASYLSGFFVDGLYWAHIGGPKGAGLSWEGLDPKTGELKKKYLYPEGVRVSDACYRDQATVRFLLGGHSTYIDVATGKFVPRATGLHASCGFGAMPANGLLYGCALYMPYRFLQSDMAYTATVREEPPDEDRRLEKGPAFGKASGQEEAADDWPCYRHDPARTSRTATAVPTEPKQLWSADVGARLSPPTIANGKVFVASIDDHKILALDAASGDPLWSYTVGGRVTIPPTYYKGMCIFGAADGWAYCLNAADGKLAWRYRAARTSRRIMDHEQIASPWPVASGVLAVDGLIYLAAGRHCDVDGGVEVFALEPATGKIAWQKPVAKLTSTAGLLISDGQSVSMISHKARFALKPGGANPASHIYPEGTLYADKLNPTYVLGGKIDRSGPRALVTVNLKAIVRAGDTLFVAGRPDAENAEDAQIQWVKGKRGAPIQRMPDKHPSENFKPDDCKLWAFSAGDGKKLSELAIPAEPVFDGLAAAGGRLYLSTKDGKLLCFGKK